MARKNKMAESAGGFAPVSGIHQQTDPNDWLPEETRQLFQVIGWTGSHRQHFGAKFKAVNLKTLTPAEAARLIQRGFTKLVAIEKKEESV